MKDRIKKVRNDYGKSIGEKVTQEKFAKILNVSHASIQSWELGRKLPSSAAIGLICEKFNVNRTWLETGEGEQYGAQTQNQKIAEFINRVMEERPDAIRKRLITALSNLPDEGWDMLDKFLDDLMENK